MAFRAATSLSRNQQCASYARVGVALTSPAFISESPPYISQHRTYHKRQNGDQGKQNDYSYTWRQSFAFGFGCGVVTPAIVAGLTSHVLLAEENDEKKLKEKETIVRKTQTLSKIFDYFAAYRYTNYKGKSVNLMGIKGFYNAATPGSSITHGTGVLSEANYSKVTDTDIQSPTLYESEQIPAPHSILNKIQKEGLLSYTDFCFLMNILATPRRYMDVAFLAFDITGDGNLNAQEYLEVMSNITKHTGGLARYEDCGTPEELMNEPYSGLMNYFFGKDRSKIVSKDNFLKVREDIIDDILWLEFTRYSHELPDLPNIYVYNVQSPIITDVEFCEHLLANVNIPTRNKKAMIKRVTKFFGISSENPTQIAEGITFEGFRSFCHLLYSGGDFRRAMFFINKEKGGINREEFKTISRWISGVEVDAHIVDVLFLLLDENENQLISSENLEPIFHEWRLSRGFLQASSQGAGIIDLKLS